MNWELDVETEGSDGDITATADNQIIRTAYNSRKLATHLTGKGVDLTGKGVGSIFGEVGKRADESGTRC